MFLEVSSRDRLSECKAGYIVVHRSRFPDKG